MEDTRVLVEPELAFFNVSEEEDVVDELFADTDIEFELCCRVVYLVGKFVIVGMLRRCMR